MFGLGKKTEAEKEAQRLANKLADETPADEQEGIFPQTPQLGPFGSIPSAQVAQSDAFVDRKDKA